MESVDYWLCWKPQSGNTAQKSGIESIASRYYGAPQPASDTSDTDFRGCVSENAEDFSRWALGHCLFRDGCLWSAAALHGYFCEWCIAKGTVGCMLPTFAALLRSEGFVTGTGTTAGVVYGLVPKAEYLALTAPELKAAPERDAGGRRTLSGRLAALDAAWGGRP